MRILLTNDDGINAKGIQHIAKALEKEHEVIIVAPSSERSACSHSITLTKPITIKECTLEGIKSKAYAISGTPADCVRIGIDVIVKDKIDLVVSGINKGYNRGTDVLYSGTVSAAVEAALQGIPSLALSQEVSKEIEDYSICSKYALRVIDICKNNPIGEDVVLNLNAPLCEEKEVKGLKVCKVGKTSYKHEYIEYIGENERGYHIKGVLSPKDYQGDDVDFLAEKYVTLSPIHFDFNNFNILKEVEAMFEDK